MYHVTFIRRRKCHQHDRDSCQSNATPLSILQWWSHRYLKENLPAGSEKKLRSRRVKWYQTTAFTFARFFLTERLKCWNHVSVKRVSVTESDSVFHVLHYERPVYVVWMTEYSGCDCQFFARQNTAPYNISMVLASNIQVSVSIPGSATVLRCRLSPFYKAPEISRWTKFFEMRERYRRIVKYMVEASCEISV